MSVVAANRQRTRRINLPLLKQIAESLLAHLKIKTAELEITVLSAKEMTRLNEGFLQHAGSTDVITFDYANAGGRFLPGSEKAHAPAGCSPSLHGEIFICVDEAVLQARKFHGTWQSEVVRYLVHGVLHLVGYDDLRPADRRNMKRAEDRLLRRIARRFSLAELAQAGKLGRCRKP